LFLFKIYKLLPNWQFISKVIKDIVNKCFQIYLSKFTYSLMNFQSKQICFVPTRNLKNFANDYEKWMLIE